MGRIMDPSSERHRLTVVFCDLSGSTKLAQQLEPEDYAQLLRDIREIAASIAAKHGGELTRADGDGFIFIFGYPQIHEDASRRAIEASLEIHDHIQRYKGIEGQPNLNLNFHTGIQSGVVILSTGSETVGRYDMLGDTVNLASKLCGAAGAGEILVSDTTLGGDRHLFDVSDVFSVAVTDKGGAVAARRIRGRRTRGTRLSSRLLELKTPFVGRGDDLKWLRRFVDEGEHSPRVALIEAPLGMGKSRLLSEFRRELEAQNRTVHTGFCESYLGTAPLQPIKHLIHSALRSRPDGSAQHLPAPVRDLLDSDTTTLSVRNLGAVHTAIADILFGSDLSHKSVLLIDDWQWADDFSRQIIDHLLDKQGRDFSLILTSRTVDEIFVSRRQAAVLPLEPLHGRDVRRAVAKIAPTLNPFAVSKIEDLAGGNPLYIEELCHAATRPASAVETGDDDAWLYALSSARLQGEADAIEDAVRVAAVIGDTVPRWLLEEVYEEEITDEFVERLSAADFLHPDETGAVLRFKNGVTRQAIYSVVGLRARKALHKRVAAAILEHAADGASVEDHGRLAHHFAHCGETERAIMHATIAGDCALSASALDKAQFFYGLCLTEIIKSGSGDACLIDVIKKYGRASILDPSSEQVDLLNRVGTFAGEIGDDGARAWADYWRGFIQYGIGSPRRALESLLTSKRIADQRADEDLRNRIRGTIGQIYVAAADYEEAHPALDEAIAMQTVKRSDGGAPVALTYSLACKGFAFADAGQFEHADTHFSEAMTLLEPHEHDVRMSILAFLGGAELWRGDFDSALAHLGEILPRSRKTRSRYFYAKSRALMGVANFYLNRHIDQLYEVEEVTQWLLSGSHQRISLNFGYLAEGFAQAGDHGRARTYAARALQRARVGDRLGETAAYRALALIAKAGYARRSADHYVRFAYWSARARTSEREHLMTQLLVHRTLDGTVDDPTERLRAMGVDASRFFFVEPGPKAPVLQAQSEILTISEAGIA